MNSQNLSRKWLDDTRGFTNAYGNKNWPLELRVVGQILFEFSEVVSDALSNIILSANTDDQEISQDLSQEHKDHFK